MKQYKYIFSFLLLLAAIVSSCTEDEDTNEFGEGDIFAPKVFTIAGSEEYASMNIFHWDANTIIGKTEYAFPVYITSHLDKDVSVQIEADPSLVDVFNQEHGTEYEALPASAFELAAGGKVTIEAGKSASRDSLKLELTNRESLRNMKGYLVPLTIKSVNTDEKHVSVSSNKKTAFVILDVKVNNIDTTNPVVIGPFADRSAWKASLSEGYVMGGRGIDKLFDGNTVSGCFTYATNSTYYQSNLVFVIDLGKKEKIQGFRLSPYYDTYLTAYGDLPRKFEIAASDDEGSTKKWNYLGEVNYSSETVGGTSADPDYKYVRLNETVETRYLRFYFFSKNEGGISSTKSYRGFGELDAILAE